MCKVFMVAGIKKQNVDKVWRFVKAIARPMSRVNNDGLGYAAITAEGKLFGERWLTNAHAFDSTKGKELDERVLSVFGKMVVESTKKDEPFEYNSFGEIDRDNIVAITMHTRAATSPKGLLNTHPFVQDGISLIHNGVIKNYEDFKERATTCDSEAILKAYIQEGVQGDAENIKKMTTLLKGYYACGVLSNTEAGPILDIFKSTGARLHVAYVDQLEAYVLSTDNDDIKDICKELGYHMGQVFTILPKKFIRIDAITGKEKLITEFEEASEYTYNDWYNRSNPTQNRTSMTSGKNTGTENSSMKGTGDNLPATVKNQVYPFPKHKKASTHISDDMMNYFRSGPRKIVAMNERDMQEEIMNQERFFGSSRW